MATFTDQLNRCIELTKKPQRIVSLVPSQTELLFDLGLREEVVGITKFCVHPKEWFERKPRVGGTKTLAFEKIKSLRPDLILAAKEENVQDQIEELAKAFPVWVSDVDTLDDALKMIEAVGELTAKQSEAMAISQTIQDAFSQLVMAAKLKTCYLIWQEPFMTIGGDTFINDMLNKAGFENIFRKQMRYPTISIEQIQAIGCEVLLLSSEPYPFKQKHIEEWKRYLPQAKIVLADGEMFSWYGSRLQYAPAYFKSLRRRIEAMP